MIPDLTPLFWIAGFGLICAAVIVLGMAGWLGWHLYGALALYLGAA